MEIRTIAHNSPEYDTMVSLRIRALLEPIGVPAHYIDPQKEAGDIFIAAFEGDQMIGCCVLTPLGKDLVQLRQMAVDPNWQGKGRGAAIVQFAEEKAKAAGFRKLFMHARNPVIAFYQKSGYTIAGEEFFEVGIGHHRMEKELAEA